MFKALFHKQMLEVRRMYFYNKKTGTVATKGSRSTGLMILFIFIYLIMIGSFFALSFLIGEPLVNNGLAWVFFMIMTILAFLVGIIGSVMSTSAALFQAKDNEFLLAMPIPPSKILIARMVSVYIMGVVYESMIMIPAILFYFIMGHPSFLSVILCILGIFVLGFLVLVFSCLFGWIIALISSKLKNKKILTTVILVIFIGLFIYLRFQADAFFRYLAEHGQEIGEAVKGWGYPLYSLGLGMSGDILAFLVFTAITAALFVLTCLVMSKSFKRIVSVKDEGIKAEFSEAQIRTRSIGTALRRKEFKHFTSSVTYMVNCGLGILFLIAGAVILLIKIQDVRYLADSFASQTPLLGRYIPVAGAFAVCLLTAMCDIAAPSISLEGKNIWLLQTMPVDPYDIFKSKIFLHVTLTGIPALICTIAMIIVFRPDVFTAVCMILCVAFYVILSGSAMLALDLKRPMLDWTNETQPVKQSVNILFSWLGGMILALAFAALYLLVGAFLAPSVYLLLCTVILAVLSVLLLLWFKGRGRLLFAGLGQ